MESEKGKQRAAQQAFRRFASDVSGFLVYGGSVGSSVVFKSNSGEPVLLTARHVAEDLTTEAVFGCSNGRDAQKVSTGEIVFGPERPVALRADGREPLIDVAAIRLSTALANVLPTTWCSADQLAEDLTVESTDVVLLCGYPAFLAVRVPGPQMAFGLNGIGYTTGVNGFDKYGRLEATWGEALVDTDSPPHPTFAFDATKPVKLGSPAGISGGGLWRFRGTTTKEELWAPASHGRLLGVPCAWDSNQTQFVEPVSLWSGWFRDLLARW
jgi:hypothetical protein